jgi:hypothetical protein
MWLAIHTSTLEKWLLNSFAFLKTGLFVILLISCKTNSFFSPVLWWYPSKHRSFKFQCQVYLLFFFLKRKKDKLDIKKCGTSKKSLPNPRLVRFSSTVGVLKLCLYLDIWAKYWNLWRWYEVGIQISSCFHD